MTRITVGEIDLVGLIRLKSVDLVDQTMDVQVSIPHSTCRKISINDMTIPVDFPSRAFENRLLRLR